MAEKKEFNHLSAFPFCVGEKNPAEENQKFNNLYLGVGVYGVGSAYPVGMLLEDAMALYWRSSSISWQFRQSITGECLGFDENGNLVPTGTSYNLEDYGSGGFSLTKPNSFEGRVCEPFEHRFTGSWTAYRFVCPPEDQTNFINPRITTTSFYPMSCFFAPAEFPPPNSGPNGPTVPYRILKYNNLYYPSLLLAFWSYSRLYVTNVFENFDSELLITSYPNVELTINGNTYSIPMLQAYNYTNAGEYDVNIGNITCGLWTP